jgi:hypothetical protein
VLHAAVVAHLAGLGRVFDAPPVRAAMPYVVVDDPVLAAGDAVGVAGRSGSVAVACIDGGVSPERVRALLGEVEAAMATLPALLGEGWRVTAVRLVRSAVARGKGERWTATSVFAVRMFRSN